MKYQIFTIAEADRDSMSWVGTYEGETPEAALRAAFEAEALPTTFMRVDVTFDEWVEVSDDGDRTIYEAEDGCFAAAVFRDA